jgi:drug/metabolite transporter (DMT)-like permease
MSISSHSPGSRVLTVASTLLLCAVVPVAVIVGVLALQNPNHIQFGSSLSVLGEFVAAGAAVLLGLGVQAQRRRRSVPLFAAGLTGAFVSLAMLGLVAFILSFNQL